MTLAWREGVFAAPMTEGIILLDVRTGRYSGVSPGASEALAREAGGELLGAVDCETLAPLLARGLLVPGGERSALQPPPPTSSIVLGPQARATIFHTFAALIAQGTASLTLRLVGFPTIYRLLKGRFDRGWWASEPKGGDVVASLVLALRLSDLIFSRRDRCLTRSLAARLLFLLYRCDAALVIGVRAGPFAAHCWVERHGCVMNDDLAEVLAFTPILAV